MTNLKTLLMTGVAAIALAAPVTAQSVGTSADGSGSVGASVGSDGVSAETGATGDVSADAGTGADADASGDMGVSGDAAMDTETAQGDVQTDVEGNVDAGTDMASGESGASGQAKAGSLIGLDVASAAGESIGEIDDVVEINGETMAVVGVGGFLGIGEHDVALPVTELMYDGNTVTAMGYTREQMESMAEYNAEVATSVDSETMVDLGRS